MKVDVDKIISERLRYYKDNLKSKWSKWLLIFTVFYLVATLVGAINYEVAFCKSNFEEFNGQMKKVEQPYIDHVNNLLLNKEVTKAYVIENYYLNCYYDSKAWHSLDDKWSSLWDSYKLSFVGLI